MVRLRATRPRGLDVRHVMCARHGHMARLRSTRLREPDVRTTLLNIPAVRATWSHGQVACDAAARTWFTRDMTSWPGCVCNGHAALLLTTAKRPGCA